MNNCPICNKELKKEYEDYLEHTLCEYSYQCPDKCYYEDFAYGNYRNGFNNSENEFCWSYKTPQKEIDLIYIKIQEEAERIKKLL